MKHFLNLLISMILLQSCQEYYSDPDIDNGDELIVVEGLITNEPGPYRVKITKTLPYNQPDGISALPEPVINVVVSIRDNTGNTEILTEVEPGVYYTSSMGMRGEAGKTYTLRLETPDGYSYESESCTMGAPAFLEPVYAETGEIKILEKNETGTYIETSHPGVSLYMNVLPAPDQEYYYKVETRVLKETSHLEWRQGRPNPPARPPSPTTVYCWELSSVSNDKDLMSNSNQNSKDIKKRPIGFITSDIFSETDEINDPSYLVGAITTTTLYSVPKRIYEIFQQLNTQTNPANSIFDPIPTRIESNITCINEPSRIVLGYFSAASVSRRNQFFRWTDTAVAVKNIEIIPSLPGSDGCESTVPPDFWITP